jgi:hypothetical protein
MHAPLCGRPASLLSHLRQMSPAGMLAVLICAFFWTLWFYRGYQRAQGSMIVSRMSIRPGWFMGYGRDGSDFQWNDFRGNVPILMAAMAAHLAVSIGMRRWAGSVENAGGDPYGGELAPQSGAQPQAPLSGAQQAPLLSSQQEQPQQPHKECPHDGAPSGVQSSSTSTAPTIACATVPVGSSSPAGTSSGSSCAASPLLGADATGTAGDLGTTIPAVHRARIWAQLALSGVFLFILFGSRVAFYVIACAINYVLTMPRAKDPTANGIVSRGSSSPTSGWLPGTYPLPQYFYFCDSLLFIL